MANNHFAVIVQTLTALTEAGKQEWLTGPVAESFYTQIGKEGVSIRSVGADYVLSIYNENGESVESLSDPELKSSGYNTAYEELSKLYDLSRRNALGTDKIISSIIENLSLKLRR